MEPAIVLLGAMLTLGAANTYYLDSTAGDESNPAPQSTNLGKHWIR